MAFKASKPHTVSVGSLVLDRVRFEVRVGRTEILLRPREFDLLWELVSRAGQVVTRESLMATVWQQEVQASRTVDSHIATVRKKLGVYGLLIETVWGLGYRLLNSGKSRSVLLKARKPSVQAGRRTKGIRH